MLNNFFLNNMRSKNSMILFVKNQNSGFTVKLNLNGVRTIKSVINIIYDFYVLKVMVFNQQILPS